MTTLQEMYQRTFFTPDFDRMIQSVQPMCDCFGVNGFYYTRIVSNGSLDYFATLGTHLPWQEFFLENIHEMDVWPTIRQPEKVKQGVVIFKEFNDPLLEENHQLIWNRFHTNPVFNTIRAIPHGIEQFGFSLKSNHPKAEYNLLRALPLLFKFIDFFYQENRKLIQLSCENQVEISNLVGPTFYQLPVADPITEKRGELLKQLGLGNALSLTFREKEMLKFLAHGYPASYIAKELHLSTRTVEHHIEDIKQKLYCDSKVELIKTAHAISEILH